jgi:multidrug efflux system outer membrane protein
MSYEVDAWGRIRRQVQAATANEQASAADLQFVRLTVAASVATDYFAVREADAETKIVSDTQIELERGFKVTSDQFRRGIISELAVKQSQAILDQARAQLEALYLRRAQSEHAIAVLCGVPAEGFHIQVQDALQNLPSVPPGLPAAMLQRRPDILAAERLAAAASAQIGVAKAAYYPSFTLSAAVGYESVNPASLLNWQNTIASLIGSATAPIFTGGRLRANVDQATAAYREAVANYEKSVLVGYGDVEDQLAAIHYLARQADAENSVVSSATRAEEIASNRYKAGLVSYLDVVFAQQTLLQNEQVLTQLKGLQAVATVSLIRALGGGW